MGGLIVHDQYGTGLNAGASAFTASLDSPSALSGLFNRRVT
ncbi:hypothetical protein QNM99_11335 [Pseudomonas sp. PCH446]